MQEKLQKQRRGVQPFFIFFTANGHLFISIILFKFVRSKIDCRFALFQSIADALEVDPADLINASVFPD